MHSNLTSFSAEIPINDEKKMKKFNKIMDKLQDKTIAYVKSEAKKLGINEIDMWDIYYLRTRSRWTQAKENHLIQLSKAGKQLPNVLAGEF